MDDARLVAAVRDQEPGAAEELISCHGDRLLRSAFLLCGDETDAEDLVQETFVTAFRSMERFRGQSALYTWLHGILLNLSRHYHREANRLVYDERLLNHEAIGPEADPNRLDLESVSTRLMEALQQLSASHREAVVLRYYEEMKIQDIARHLGISIGTVKSRLHYAIEELQRLLPAEMNLFGVRGTNEVTSE